MGDVLLRQGRLQDAEALYRAAFLARPSDGVAHYKLATVLYREHREAEVDGERMKAQRLTEQATLAGRMRLKLGNATADTE